MTSVVGSPGGPGLGFSTVHGAAAVFFQHCWCMYYIGFAYGAVAMQTMPKPNLKGQEQHGVRTTVPGLRLVAAFLTAAWHSLRLA